MFREGFVKNMLVKMTKMPHRVSSQKKSNSSIKNKSASSKGLDSAIFVILMQRTTFTVLLVTSLLCQSVCAQVTEPSTSTTRLSPVYIPLTENSENIETIVTEKPTQRYFNQTFKTGNSLFDSLMNECVRNPSVSCIQKNVYTYLDDTLGFTGDVNITDGFKFMKSKLPYWKYTEAANRSENDVDSEEGSYDDAEEEARFSESPIEEVTDALYGKGISFFMSHNMELKLPEMMFNGATLKVSPRGMEGDGALVKLDLIPKEVSQNENGQGRIFFKKIKKWIKSKILLAILAIVVIVKLIKLKLFVFLPLILGVHKAKKMFLSFLLFVFPALSHIFKLCSWYHSNYHGTKYHHHHHQISHLHHSSPHLAVTPGFPGHIGHPPAYSSVEFHGPYPPAGHPQGPSYSHESDGWAASGPGLGPEFLSSNINRNAIAENNGNFHPKPDDAHEINSWGLGTSGAASSTLGTVSPYLRPSPYYNEHKYMKQAIEAAATNGAKVTLASPLTGPLGPIITSYNNARRPNGVTQAEKEALIRAAQKQEQYRMQLKAQELLKNKGTTLLNSIPSKDTLVSPVYDPFYSPLLQRVDQVFTSLAFHEEPCRERLVCSMYKNPQKFSPHSNIISNEISREASELPKPTTGSSIALRFFRYVQAARDGQEKKDCIALYANCNIDTEKK